MDGQSDVLKKSTTIMNGNITDVNTFVLICKTIFIV